MLWWLGMLMWQTANGQCVLPSNAPDYDCLDKTTLRSPPEQNTFAYGALAWLTGNVCSDSFLPPGKIGEFMGFQFIRDSEPNGLGHNSQFSDYISQYIFTKLSDSELMQLNALMIDEGYINNTKSLLYHRQDMSNALRKLLISETSLLRLNLTAVADYYGEIQRTNGLIILQRAKVIGSIIRALNSSLVSEMRTFFAPDVLTIPSTLPALVESNKARFRSLGMKPAIQTTLWNGIAWTDASLLVTLGNQIMAWLTDDVGVYFAPEEVADVFGCFYLKDIEVYNVQTGSTVNLNETADRGNQFLGLLTAFQRMKILVIADSVTDENANGKLWQIKTIRTAINAELRKFMIQDSVNEILLSNLQYQLGYIDGSIVASLVKAYTEIYWNMTEAQRTAMRLLRDPTNPQKNCPNVNIPGGSWMLASPVSAVVAREGEPAHIWLESASHGTASDSTVPPSAQGNNSTNSAINVGNLSGPGAAYTSLASSASFTFSVYILCSFGFAFKTLGS